MSRKFLKLYLLWSLGLTIFEVIAVKIEEKLTFPNADLFSSRPYNPIFSPALIIWFILVIFVTFKLTRSMKNEMGKEPNWFQKTNVFLSLWLLGPLLWSIILLPVVIILKFILTSFL